MKSRILACITAMTFFAALAIPLRLAAQDQEEQNKKQPHYTVTDLGPGPDSRGGVNNKGWVDATALLPNGSERGFLWRKGAKTVLGTFGGPNSVALHPPSERGQVVGLAETSTPDPNGEDFCGFGTHLICLPFVWQNGVMTPLPTLGGNNGNGSQVNNRGQVAGVAENTTLDATCPTPSRETKPVIWENGGIQELPTLPGDPNGFLVAINDQGQAVGISGSCLASLVMASLGTVDHNALWQNGTVIDLGNLGGTTNNEPNNINNQSQVVGFSGVAAGPTPPFHAFLWTEDRGMQDLGTLPFPLNVNSFADGNNDKGQVVGGSCNADFSNCSAFLWENGVMTDLNTLVPGGGSTVTLLEAFSINSDGSIESFGVTSADEPHAFLLTPTNGEVASESAAPAMPGETSERPKGVLPENVRKLLQQRMGLGRFGGTGATFGPIVTLKPTSLTFATQLVGTTSPAQPVTLTNTGNATLSITSIAITGADPGDFAQTNTCGSSVPAGKSCTISVTFKSTQRGTRTGAVSITDNAPGSPQKLSLTGTGTVVKLNPTSLHFGCGRFPPPCHCTPPQTTTLTNTGSTTLSITGINITGSNSFHQTNTCGNSVGAGKSCTITVTFFAGGGHFTGDVSISDNGGGSPQKVSLFGSSVCF